MSDRAISRTDVHCLARVFGKLQPELVEYAWRGTGDDFMLRVELLGLRDRIDTILKRSERPEPHKAGFM